RARDVERVVASRRSPERTLAAAGDNLERMLFRQSPGDHVCGFAGIRRLKDGHGDPPQKRGRSVWAKNSRCWQPACSRSAAVKNGVKQAGGLIPFALNDFAASIGRLVKRSA